MNKADHHFMNQIAASKDGITCVCCGQFAKIYRRNIHSTTAAQLIKAYKLGAATDYVHVSKLLFKGSSGIGDFPKAVYWNLIEEMPNNDPQKRTSGYWKLTPLGIDFVRGMAGVTKYAHIYNGELVEPKFSGPVVFIDECLGKKWDYREMMEG